jgi:hypothetical protein
MVPARLMLAALLVSGAGVMAQRTAPPAPAAAPALTAPLPDERQFLSEARKRLASNDLIQSRYSFRERTTELKLNPLGRTMGTGPTNVYEIYPHPEEEMTYRRLIERDGRQVSANDLAKQDRDYREKLAEWQRRLAREGSSGRAERLRKAEEARQKDEAMAREAIDLFEFHVVGRDTWNGEPAIVVSFVPRPDVPPRTREGRIAHAFAGRAWIHEFDYEVMNVEAKAIDDVSFGWGMIAKIYRGSTARFTRRRLGNTWLPIETRFDGTGRALMIRRVVIEFKRDYFDYQPFDVADLPARLGWAPAP